MIEHIAFIGTGVMGTSMVKNLLRAGYTVSVYNRTKAHAKQAVLAGALWCDSVADCVLDADAVVTIVGFPKDVREVYFGAGGILENARRGAYLIDMTTSEPSLAMEISVQAAEKGLRALDAPVSGGDGGARDGTLSIMVGGDRSAFEACMPVFQALGKTVVLQGGPGCGQHAKMCNQIAIAGAIGAVCEALAYAKAAGLDPQTVLDSIGGGAAGSWQMRYNAPKILRSDWSAGFYLKHFVKDLRIAQQEADAAGISLGVLDTVLDMYEMLLDEGKGELGTQALMQYYDEIDLSGE